MFDPRNCMKWLYHAISSISYQIWRRKSASRHRNCFILIRIFYYYYANHLPKLKIVSFSQVLPRKSSEKSSENIIFPKRTCQKNQKMYGVQCQYHQCGGFQKCWYPPIIHSYLRIFCEINHPAIGVPPWLWNPPRSTAIIPNIGITNITNINITNPWSLPEIGIPQIIQVMKEPFLVLKPMGFWGSPILRNLHVIIYNHKYEYSPILSNINHVFSEAICSSYWATRPQRRAPLAGYLV
jgi:hypothetical protein